MQEILLRSEKTLSAAADDDYTSNILRRAANRYGSAVEFILHYWRGTQSGEMSATLVK